ncbi:MAG: hypothetical protein K0U84_01715 [Actinomycetia bacterium]|nr:hypothetical protein [Actinomycetes bacterium]
MTQCQVCEGRAQLFLCTTHIGVLQTTLTDLPWWLARLNEAALGQVRLGDGGRRGTRAHELDEYTGPDDDANAARLERDLAAGRFDLDAVLAPARINNKARKLYAAAHNDLGMWVRHLCETRGVECPPIPAATVSARWLRKNANAIAADESAVECYKTCVDLTDRIRDIVNRPEPPRFCGPCTTVLTAEQRQKLIANKEEDREVCMVQLYAKRKATHVTCPHCKAEHDIEKLYTAMLDEADEYSFTISDLVDHILPKLGQQIPRRTLQRWAMTGKLMASGYEGGVARYQLATVRKLHDTRRRTG